MYAAREVSANWHERCCPCHHICPELVEMHQCSPTLYFPPCAPQNKTLHGTYRDCSLRCLLQPKETRELWVISIKWSSEGTFRLGLSCCQSLCSKAAARHSKGVLYLGRRYFSYPEDFGYCKTNLGQGHMAVSPAISQVQRQMGSQCPAHCWPADTLLPVLTALHSPLKLWFISLHSLQTYWAALHLSPATVTGSAGGLLTELNKRLPFRWSFQMLPRCP